MSSPAIIVGSDMDPMFLYLCDLKRLRALLPHKIIPAGPTQFRKTRWMGRNGSAHENVVNKILSVSHTCSQLNLHNVDKVRPFIWGKHALAVSISLKWQASAIISQAWAKWKKVEERTTSHWDTANSIIYDLKCTLHRKAESSLQPRRDRTRERHVPRVKKFYSEK